MSTPLDLQLVPKVLEIINLYGTLATFTVSSSTYDPATGKTTAGSSSSYTSKVSPPGDYRKHFEQVVPNDDLQVILPASGLSWTPALNMSVTVAGGSFTITMIMPLYTGDEIAAWILNLHGHES